MPVPPVSLSKKDRALVVIILLLLGVAIIVFLHFQPEAHARHARQQYLRHLVDHYGIKEDQRKRIQEIEIRFHGSGSVFTRPSHGIGEEAEHRREISRQMTPEAASRFLTEEADSSTASQSR